MITNVRSDENNQSFNASVLITMHLSDVLSISVLSSYERFYIKNIDILNWECTSHFIIWLYIYVSLYSYINVVIWTAVLMLQLIGFVGYGV